MRTKPTIPEVMPLVKAYRALPGNSVGGSLHVVLDDGNIDDGSVIHCRRYASERRDDKGVELADLLLQMSKTQRRKISARFYEK